MVKGRSKNVENLRGASIKEIIIIGKVCGTNLKWNRHGVYYESVLWLIPKEWNIYYSSLILGGYVIKRNHHVNSLGLNGSKIHAIYLVELRKEMT